MYYIVFTTYRLLRHEIKTVQITFYFNILFKSQSHPPRYPPTMYLSQPGLLPWIYAHPSYVQNKNTVKQFVNDGTHKLSITFMHILCPSSWALPIFYMQAGYPGAGESLALHEWPTSWHPPSGSWCSFLLLRGEPWGHPWSTSLGTWQPYHFHNRHLKWLVQWGACHGISGIPCTWFL